jgi:hypothetical protein
MRTHLYVLISCIVFSYALHLAHIEDSVGGFINIIKRMLNYFDSFSIRAFFTYSINIVSIVTGSVGLIMFLRDRHQLNRWLMAFIVVANFRTITTVPAMLTFPTHYFPSITQVGIFYYLGLTAMILTLLASLNYFIRVALSNDMLNESQNLSLVNSRKVRLINYLVDLSIIAGIAFDKYYVLMQTIDLKYVMVICFLLYYLFSESLYQRTLGKLITDTLVPRSTNFVGKVIVRTFSRLIPLEPFSYLAKSGQGWHDTLSKTGLYSVKNQN